MTRLRAPEVSAQWSLWGGAARLVIRPDGTSAPTLQQARKLVDQTTMEIERACSRFRDDSEVSRLTAAAGRPVAASALLRSTVQVALRAAAVSGGAVDPTLGYALVAVGYDRDISQVPADRATKAIPVRRSANWRDVAVDDQTETITVPAGVLLDLGATAKAHAADLAAARVHREFACPVLVSLGGDLAIVGSRPDEPWQIEILEQAEDPAGPLVEVGDCGVATSSTRGRNWRMNGRPMHHLLDPVTGLPVREVWRTVTVTANSCVDANVGATSTIVKGKAGLGWLAETGLAARLVSASGAVTLVGGWPS